MHRRHCQFAKDQSQRRAAFRRVNRSVWLGSIVKVVTVVQILASRGWNSRYRDPINQAVLFHLTVDLLDLAVQLGEIFISDLRE